MTGRDRRVHRPAAGDGRLVGKIVATMTAGGALVVGALFLDGRIESTDAPAMRPPAGIELEGPAPATGNDAANALTVPADD